MRFTVIFVKAGISSALLGCAQGPPPPTVPQPVALPFELLEARPTVVTVRLPQLASVAVFEFSATGWLRFLGQAERSVTTGPAILDLSVPLHPDQFVTGRAAKSRGDLHWERPCLATTEQFETDPQTGARVMMARDICLARGTGQMSPPDPALTWGGYWLILVTVTPFTPAVLEQLLPRVRPDPAPAALARQLINGLPPAGHGRWGYVIVPTPSGTSP